VVREALRIGFPGGAYTHLFYVTDVQAIGPTMNGEWHLALDSTDFLFAFPLKGDGRARLIGTVREDVERQHENLSWNDVSKGVIDQMHIDVERVNWFSTYRVYHRVADHFRSGRAFVLGDAARELRTMCNARTLPLHVFPWRPEIEVAGLLCNADYLVRPDGYVAVAEPESSVTAIASYLDAREIFPPK
jgi:hypothetical protein